MKRLLPVIAFMLLLITILIPAGLALASYNYSEAIQVFNNSTINYPLGLPVLVSVNSAQLYDYGYISASGLDTDLQEGAVSRDFMASSARLGIFFPSFLGGQNRHASYRLGDVPGQTTFPIITGVGGNFAVVDAPALWWSDNGSVSASVYFDATVAGNIVDKQLAVNMSADGVGGITGKVYVTSVNAVQAAQNSDQIIDQTIASSRAGFRWDNFKGYISSVQFLLCKSSAPTGTANVTVRSVTGDTLLGILGTLDVSTLGNGTGNYAYKTFNSNPVEVAMVQDIRVQFEWANGDGVNYVYMGYENSDADSNTVWTEYDGAYHDSATDDATFDMDYLPIMSVEATGVDSGKRVIEVGIERR